jgi:hypothetical protein
MLYSLLHAATLGGKQSVAQWPCKHFESYVGHRVTRLVDFSPIRLLFVGSLPKNGSTLGYKFIPFSHKQAV